VLIVDAEGRYLRIVLPPALCATIGSALIKGTAIDAYGEVPGFPNKSAHAATGVWPAGTGSVSQH
jgi:hypothetical protein